MGANSSTKKKERPTDNVSLEWRILVKEDKLKWNQQDGHFTIALAGENIEKNRYQAVLAPDKSRVKLQEHDGCSDYINANYVDGVHSNSEKFYIATQAPRPETMEDFWRMIWEQKVYVIVKLTNLEEGGRVKAHQYWPKVGTKQFGCMSVTLNSSEEENGGVYCLRTFTITPGGGGGLKSAAKTDSTSQAKRLIYQYHFLAWPDMGVPDSAAPLIEMMKDIDKQHAINNPTSPILVHCSAGIGRTGTFIVIHSVLKKLKESNITDINELVLQPILSKMRDQRPGFVQQKVQYAFCYRAIKFAVTGEDDPIEFTQYTKKKHKKKPSKNSAEEVVEPKEIIDEITVKNGEQNL